MKISYLRPVKFQPGRLEVLASTAYTTHVIAVLRQHHRHTFSDAVCLRVMRRRLGDHLTQAVARTVREELFRYGCHLLLQKEAAWSALRDFHLPDLLVPFLYVFYTSDLRVLELPGLVRHQDRLAVLDLLNNVGTPGGHGLEQVKIRIFDRAEISVEEGYLLKRVLRGFANVKSLTLWKVRRSRLSINYAYVQQCMNEFIHVCTYYIHMYIYSISIHTGVYIYVQEI
jgi:hypothetical protein